VGGPAAAGAILAQLQPAGLAYEGLGRMENDGWSWGWNAGLLLRLGDAARVGVSYRSAVRHDLEGQVGSAVSAVPLNFEDTWRAGLGVNCASTTAGRCASARPTT
jgi:long-subunit fatty acid transport protein